jgi:hypothetical protein
MKNQSDTTPVQSFESTVKDTKTAPIKPKFSTEQLTTNGFKKHLNELISDNDFPINHLPAPLREIIRQTNECLNFPIDYIASALISAASTAIGNTYVSKWKWYENGCLFMVLVGNPGVNKTHPITWAFAPISEKDRESYKKYQEAIKTYEIEHAAYLKAKKSEAGDPPEKPVLQKHIVSDCTIEALVYVLQNNPRGCCSHNDELAGWINNMNRYTNGSDVQQWLSMWSGQAIVVDRKLSASIRIERPFVNVIGTIQPAVIDEMAKDNKSKNGFTDRLLFVKPKGLKRNGWNTNELDPSIRSNWFAIVNKLLSLDFSRNSEGAEMSNHLWYTKEAEAILRAWQEENIKEDEEYASELRDGISAKIETYIFRFSLILQLLKWACGEAENKTIDPETIKDAIAIAKYFKRTAIEVAEYITNKNPVDRLPENKQTIYRSLPPIFTTDTGVSIAVENGMPERTFKHWLKERDLFKNVKHGEYQKIYA